MQKIGRDIQNQGVGVKNTANLSDKMPQISPTKSHKSLQQKASNLSNKKPQISPIKFDLFYFSGIMIKKKNPNHSAFNKIVEPV